MKLSGWPFLSVVFLALIAAPAGGASRRQADSLPLGPVHFSLCGEWEFRQMGTGLWQRASVPGCVHTDLLAAGLIPDPFYRDNELEVRWIEREGWEYRRAYEVGPEVLERDHVEIVAEGLDTFAKVFVNGAKAGESENMFRTYRFEIKHLLKEGSNEIRIVFESPVEREEILESRLRYKLPGGAPHIRKAPYQFGWDWGPRLVTSGIWRPLSVEAWSSVRIEDLQVAQEFLGKDRALLHVVSDFLSDGEGDVEMEVTLDRSEASSFKKTITLRSGSNRGVVSIPIENARLWWPTGMGEQNLYEVKVSISRDGHGLDSASRRVGLRRLVLEQKSDRWGKGFAFSVNGVPFFAKGANWVPADSFPSRVTRSKLAYLLQSAVEANMNMLRVWGGGVYESQDFYDLCDELGIVVWQDFMFACALFPGDRPFLENVRLEAEDVIRRLRHHPSIGLWCGNNECEEGWFHWGWKDSLPPSVWGDYEKIFHGILPEAVRTMDPGRTYWPSSPHSDEIGQPRSDLSGDMHYWGIWHGQEPFAEFGKKFHRFFSEFGFQSFPLLETVETFTLPEDRNLTSPVMEAHQKHPAGNRLILQYMLDEFRMPKDFESLLWLSQVLQARGMKTAAEHFRSQRPRIMGSLYWQFEDCWPVASWSGIDSTGAWKALQFYARRFYSPVLVAPVGDGNRLRVFCISDRLHTAQGEYEWFTSTYDGRRLKSGGFTIKIDPLTSKVIQEENLGEFGGIGPERTFFYCEIKERNRILSTNVFHFSKPKSVDLPVPRITYGTELEDEGIAVSLETDSFAQDVFLSAPGVRGRFLDNFFDMVPGRVYRVVFVPEAGISPEVLREALRLRSLRDTY